MAAVAHLSGPDANESRLRPDPGTLGSRTLGPLGYRIPFARRLDAAATLQHSAGVEVHSRTLADSKALAV